MIRGMHILYDIQIKANILQTIYCQMLEIQK